MWSDCDFILALSLQILLNKLRSFETLHLNTFSNKITQIMYANDVFIKSIMSL